MSRPRGAAGGALWLAHPGSARDPAETPCVSLAVRAQAANPAATTTVPPRRRNPARAPQPPAGRGRRLLPRHRAGAGAGHVRGEGPGPLPQHPTSRHAHPRRRVNHRRLPAHVVVRRRLERHPRRGRRRQSIPGCGRGSRSGRLRSQHQPHRREAGQRVQPHDHSQAHPRCHQGGTQAVQRSLGGRRRARAASGVGQGEQAQARGSHQTSSLATQRCVSTVPVRRVDAGLASSSSILVRRVDAGLVSFSLRLGALDSPTRLVRFESLPSQAAC